MSLGCSEYPCMGYFKLRAEKKRLKNVLSCFVRSFTLLIMSFSSLISISHCSGKILLEQSALGLQKRDRVEIVIFPFLLLAQCQRFLEECDLDDKHTFKTVCEELFNVDHLNIFRKKI